MTDVVPGVWLNDWILGEHLGQGGFARVHLAEHAKTKARAAIKLPLDGAEADSLRREAATRDLSHPGVISIQEVHLDHDPPFLVLDLVEGESLREELQGQPLATERVLGLIRDLASALDYAHERGVLHLDIKPENVLIDRETRAPRLGDFGAASEGDARALRQSMALTAPVGRSGTPDYAAPELREGDALLERRTDVYSLGVLTFELLTGKLPLGLDRPSQLRPGLSVAVDEVLGRALAREVTRRHLSAGAFAEALREALATPDSPPSPAAPATRARSSRRAVLWLVLGLTLGGVLHAASSLVPAADRAQAPWQDRLETLVGETRRGRVGVLPADDLGGAHSRRAQQLSLALSQALGGAPLLAIDSTDLFDRARRDALASSSGCQFALRAVIPAEAHDPAREAVLSLIELGPYRVVQAEATSASANDLAERLLSRWPAERRGALALLPSVELPARVSNTTSAAFDAAFNASLVARRPPQVDVRGRAGLISRLRDFPDLRSALSVGTVVTCTLDPASGQAQAELRDLETGQSLATASAPWAPPPGHDSKRGAHRFTLDVRAVHLLERGQELALAREHLRTGRPRDALAVLQQLPEAEGADRVELLVLVARAHFELEDYALAVDRCREALTLEPAAPTVHRLLAQSSLEAAGRLYRAGKGAWYADDDEQSFQRARDLLIPLNELSLDDELRASCEKLLATVEGEL